MHLYERLQSNFVDFRRYIENLQKIKLGVLLDKLLLLCGLYIFLTRIMGQPIIHLYSQIRSNKENELRTIIK